MVNGLDFDERPPPKCVTGALMAIDNTLMSFDGLSLDGTPELRAVARYMFCDTNNISMSMDTVMCFFKNPRHQRALDVMITHARVIVNNWQASTYRTTCLMRIGIISQDQMIINPSI